MKHRERVLTALNHEEADRCPMQVSFTPEFATRLRKELKLGVASRHNPHGKGNTYALERTLDEDILLASVGWANSYYQEETETYVDEWGVGWKSSSYSTPFGQGSYTEMVVYPLVRHQAIQSYNPTYPHRPELYVEAFRTLRDYKGEYWIVGVPVTTIFETAWALRGLEALLMDFVANPDLAETILDIPYHYHLAAAKKLVKMGVDMIWIGGDVGRQHAVLI